MEETVGSITERDSMINQLASEQDLPDVRDDTPSPHLSRAASNPIRSTISFVSSLSSTISKHASPFIAEQDEEDDDEDASEALLRDIRQRTKDAAIHLSDHKNVDVNFYLTAKRRVRFHVALKFALQNLSDFRLQFSDFPCPLCPAPIRTPS